MIKAIITDIEGTTTDIDFVHKVLFPYSREKIATFVVENKKTPEILNILNDIKTIMKLSEVNLDLIIAQLIEWIDLDLKIAPLKTLQGYIWKEGFQAGAFTGHLYPDAYENLLKWHEKGIQLYVYSSGSVQAQHLLFQHSCFGDLRYLFAGYFDTQVGAKKESSSYANILNQIKTAPFESLFLSDVVEELDAARENNIQTMLLNRKEVTLEENGHPACHSFDQIQL